MNLLKSRRRSLILAVPALAMLALTACSKAENKPVSGASAANYSIPSSQAVTAAAIRQNARGFTVGQQMSTNEVFVFFDPKCPHCAMLWSQSESMRKNLKFTWIPVAFMGNGSATAGAALMAAADKTKAMNAHATDVLLAMRTNTRLPSPSTESGAPKDLADIARNTRLLLSFGADSVPYIVAVNGTDEVLMNTTGVPADKVAAAFGASAPKP